MKFTTMRHIERFLGNPLVLALYLLKLLGFPFRHRKRLPAEADQIESILILKFFGVGSIVNAFPFIDALRARCPDARIIFATFETNRAFLELTAKVDQIITVDPSSFARFAGSNARAIRSLAGLRVDICFDLEFFSKYSMVFSFLSRAAIRVGFFASYNLRSLLLTLPHSFNHYRHISRIYLSMAEAIGFKIPESGYQIALPSAEPADRERVAELVENRGGHPIVSVNPNASDLCPLRRWPATSFIELITRLSSKEPGHLFVFLGSPSERAHVEEIVRSCASAGVRAFNAAGLTSIRDLMILLEMSVVLISNDSGPVHLAAAYQTPTLALYGPETPIQYGPLNPRAVSLYKGLYCSPCINVLDNKSFVMCSDQKCMTAITVDEALEALGERFFD